jgi:hypothetical protein
MSRCKACNTIMSEAELKRVDFNTGLHLDLCYSCGRESNNAILAFDGLETSGGEDSLDLMELGFNLSNN